MYGFLPFLPSIEPLIEGLRLYALEQAVPLPVSIEPLIGGLRLRTRGRDRDI